MNLSGDCRTTPAARQFHPKGKASVRRDSAAQKPRERNRNMAATEEYIRPARSGDTEERSGIRDDEPRAMCISSVAGQNACWGEGVGFGTPARRERYMVQMLAAWPAYCTAGIAADRQCENIDESLPMCEWDGKVRSEGMRHHTDTPVPVPTG